MLTYESAADLLLLNLEEESELNILSEAASLRLQWRLQQVGFIHYSLMFGWFDKYSFAKAIFLVNMIYNDAYLSASNEYDL